MTKQKKNELEEPLGGDENGKEGSNGNHGMSENAEIPAVPATHAPHAPHAPHDSHASDPSPKKALLAVLREALAQGEGVSLPGLGSFSVVAHAARMGRNPRTGESIAIPARRRVHFKLSTGLRLRLNP